MFFEDIDEEWKESWKPEYLKTISAFYNTSGGKFIIGRRDDGTYVGVHNVKETLKSISDSIRNVLGVSMIVRSEVLDDTVCIVIDVPRGREIIDYNGQFYKRIGNTTHLIKREELKDIIAFERGTSWMAESSGKTPESLSAHVIKQFIDMGKEIRRIPNNVDPSDITAILNRYNLLCDDGTVNLAGAILFSELPHRFNQGASLKIGEFDEKSILRREDIIEVPLILLPNVAVDTLFDKYIPPTFEYEGARRKLAYGYPVDAIRELIVNAVVHMNYHWKLPTTVSVFPNRIEIFCFGGLPLGWTVETLLGKHRSVPRNQMLANVFHDAGYVEKWAQGIEKVMRLCEENGNPPPRFAQERDGLSVTVLPAIPQIDEIQGIFAPTENQRHILECISSEPTVTIRKIAEKTGLSQRAVEKNLSKLTAASVIRREGNKQTGRWIIIARWS